MHAPVPQPGPETSGDKRRERLLYRLLYGRAADRGAKAKARVALAIAAFAAVYGVIATRLRKDHSAYAVTATRTTSAAMANPSTWPVMPMPAMRLLVA